MKKKLIGLSLVTIMTSSFVFADTNKAKHELSKAEKEAIMKAHSSIIVPSAGDLANSLKKNKSLKDVDWTKFINVKIDPSKKYDTQEDKALHLGAKGADAYFLAIAKNSTNLEAVATNINFTLNRIVLNKKSLSKIIGKQTLKSLENTVKAKKWVKVLEKISKLKDDIQMEFEKANKKDLQTLNNIGGWIEGYRIAVEGLKTKYDEKATSVLVQNDLIKFLSKELNSVKSYSKKDEIGKVLTTISSILEKSKNSKLSKGQIAELSKILTTAKSFL